MERLKPKVLITGLTGFLGSWLALRLKKEFKIYGISLKNTDRLSLFNLFEVSSFANSYIQDIRDFENTKKIIKKIKPDFTIHLAAQPLVSKGYDKPFLTYQTNISGSLNLFEILNDFSSGIILNFTSDKVYLNNNSSKSFTESSQLYGEDPYSLSKSLVDMLGKSFNSKKVQNNLKITTFRCGNIIGGGDWGENRILPDYYRALKNKTKLIIRNPYSTRPWQSVILPLNAIYKFLKNYNKNYISEFNVYDSERKLNVVNLIRKINEINVDNKVYFE